MKLSQWAKKNGITYHTAWKLFRDGKLPVRSRQLQTGTILVYEDEPAATAAGKVAVYARVSGSDQKSDLDRQVGRLCAAAIAAGTPASVIVAEVGSGMNGARPKLLSLLRDPEVTTIIVETRDRLCRFGFEGLEAAMAASGRTVVVTGREEVSSDLVRDMTEVLTSFCARLYGQRSARRRAARALAAAGSEGGVAHDG